MSSSERKTKKVICDCPKCNRRLVDPRTQQEHIGLPDMGTPTRVTTQSTSSKRKRVEEPLPNSKNQKVQKVKIRKVKVQIAMILKTMIQKVKIRKVKVQITMD